MIWQKMTVILQVKTGEDELGNPVYANVDGDIYNARFTPRTDEQIALEGRDVTTNEQRYIIPCPFKTFPECKIVKFGESLFEVKVRSDLGPRWTMLQVKKYR